MNKICHGCAEHKDDILPKLRSIARSLTEDEMKKAMIIFQATKYWSNPQFKLLQEYLTNYWFSVKEVS